MISKQEILEFAAQLGLSPAVVEKDYVLGWILWGIYNNDVLRATWLFKGGTCLKKCYFETYRFSEDLDFTLVDPDHLNTDFLKATFGEISENIYAESGIELPREGLDFEIYTNPRGVISAQGKIGYRGPIAPRGDLPRVKLDLTSDEVVVTQPVHREVYHPYSDRPVSKIFATAYSYEELCAEKTRALADRCRPRDLYDVISMYHNVDLRPDTESVMIILEQKCEFKKIVVPRFDTIQNHPNYPELVSEWDNMLRHQLPSLPDLQYFGNELKGFFDWLSGVKMPEALQSYPSSEPVVRPPVMGSFGVGISAPMEKIRFAAANRLLVDLHYQGKHRLIEPYSLRRSQEGHLLLYGIKHETGQVRAYRVDRIQGATATNMPFAPRYAIELTAVGQPIIAPTFRFPKRRRKTRVTRTTGPTNIVECTYCQKRFYRKTSSRRLNPHKDKQGYPCPGRTGYLIDTRW